MMSEPPVESLLETARPWLPLALSTAATVALGRFLTRNHTPLLHCCRLRLCIGWVMNQLFLCHRMYKRSRRPFRIILMRHAESEGNVDKGVYSNTPDHALKITERGKRQAAVAGSELRELVGDESVYFIVSPYTRTRMTYDIVQEALGPRQLFMKEDPRLRELDFGNFQDLATMEETMERLILMRYFQWKVEFFERVWNPDNCETWVMERDERGSYRVVTEILDNRPASLAEVEDANDQAEGTSSLAGAQGAAEDAGNGAGSAPKPGAGGSDDCGAAAAEAAEAAEAAGAAAGTPTERIKSSVLAQQQALLLPTLEQAGATDAQVEARIGGGGGGCGGGGGGGAEEENEDRELRSSTLEVPRDSAPLEVAAHVRGGGLGVEAVDGCVDGSREEGGDDGGNLRVGRNHRSVSPADLEPPPVGLYDLKRSRVSALNLSDGGLAPGEEGCGRDDAL